MRHCFAKTFSSLVFLLAFSSNVFAEDACPVPSSTTSSDTTSGAGSLTERASSSITTPLIDDHLVSNAGGITQIQVKLADKVEKLPGRTEVQKDTDGDGKYDTTVTTWGDGTTVTETEDGKGGTKTEKKFADGRTETNTDDGKTSRTERTWPGGKTDVETYTQNENGDVVRTKDTTYPDGTKESTTGGGPWDPTEHTETTYPDGKTVTTDKDFEKGGESKTETTWPDGRTEIIKKEGYPNDVTRTEKTWPDGKTETSTSMTGGLITDSETKYPDGTEVKKHATGGHTTEETTYPDKTKVVVDNDGYTKTTSAYDAAGNKISENKVDLTSRGKKGE